MDKNPTYRFLGMKKADPLPHISGMVAIVTNSGRFFSMPEEVFDELFVLCSESSLSEKGRFEEEPTDAGIQNNRKTD